MIKLVALNDLRESPYQSRLKRGLDSKHEDIDEQEIAALSMSIDTNGLMQPIVVRSVGKVYEVIDGHRRVMALRILNRTHVHAVVKDCDEKEAMVMSVIGNLERKNLRSIELAVQYQKLLDTGIFPDKRALSQALGKDETYVGDLLKTLKMDSRIIEDLKTEQGLHDMRILRLIRNSAKVSDAGISKKQYALYQMAKSKRLSRQELAALLKKQEQRYVPRWQINRTSRRLNLTVDVSKFSPEEVLEMETLLKEFIRNSL